MQLERIGVVLRPRLPREALDLGATMLRANALAVWSAWFAFTLPFFVACNALGVLVGLPWLGWVLMWWLKPLFDRAPLYVLSRAVFDRAPGWRESLRGQRQWGWRNTLAGLSWRRLDSHRGLRLPLEFLEGTSRQQRAGRWKVLRQRISGDISLLTYGCLQFEWVLILSVWLFGAMLIPHEWRSGSITEFFRYDWHGASTAWMLVAATIGYLAMSVIEPLYVACGFALYLSRRTQLEAWDIDLAFRRMSQRLAALGKVLGVVLLCAGSCSLPLHAQTPPTMPKTTLQQAFGQAPDAASGRFAAAATDAYRDPRFGGKHRRRRWVLRHQSKPAQPVPMVPFPALGRLFAAAAKMVLWLLLLSALGLLGWFAWRHRGSWLHESDEPEPDLAQNTHAVVVNDAPLPADLAAAMRALWQAQQRREALALLYRGCVEQTAQLLKLPLAADATEADWLRHAATLDDPARARRIVAIVRTWQFAAYAGRYPDDAAIEALLQGWPVQAEALA